MSEHYDPLLGFQPDIYQRYAFLAGLTRALVDLENGRATVLDVGSGPMRLVQTFLGSNVQVVRADVDQFGDPDIELIRAGEPLPFQDAAFDLVVALDVLEHVTGPHRAPFIRELQRVARVAAIVCCPVAIPEVVEAEDDFSEAATAISGSDIDFLREHRLYGLPVEQEVVSWFDSAAGLLVAENAPLDEWLTLNLFDFIYACEFGDTEEKRRLNAVLNASARFCRPGVPHYRRFFCAVKARDRAAAAANFIAESRGGESDPLQAAEQVAQAVLRLRDDLHARSVAEISAKDATVAQLQQVLTRTEEQLRLQEHAVAERDARVSDLDEQVLRLRHDLDEVQRTVRASDARAAVLAAQLETACRERDARESELAAVRSELAQAQNAVRSIVQSRSWKLTRILRAAARLRRGATNRQAWSRALYRLRHRRVMRSYAVVAQSGLFDAAWYTATYPDVAAAAVDPLMHYLSVGAKEGREPHPLFSSSFYLESSPDVVSAGANPLVHYVTAGAAEGRDPHPLFDSSYYLSANPDVADAGVNPLAHYWSHGWLEGRNPHPLFDTAFYLQQNPDVRAAGINPLVHFWTNGAREGRDPHPLFDTSFYLEQNPDVASDPINPLVHYLSSGAREGRDPSPQFDSSLYLDSNPDVSAAGANPLVHFVLHGRKEGRLASSVPAAMRQARRPSYVPPQGLLPWFNPLNLITAPHLSKEPRLNVLVPGLGMRHLSGGPNTALALAARLACRGVRVRLMATDAPLDLDREPLWSHIRGLLGSDLPEGMELVDAHDRSRPVEIGERDIFLATAWWTAQQAKYAIQLTRHNQFVYLIQDYEPLLHPASTQQALASETYELDHVPVINSDLLAEFLAEQRIGRFADSDFARRALVFQPAVDRAVFHPREHERTGTRRRLLFYARPTNGLRNLFELGVAALQKAIADGVFTPDEWDFLAMGEAIAPVELGRGVVLTPAPWLDLAGYARQMRDSDLVLSLMLSPHPSYPPLEMAACGGLVVTTRFANKTAERMSRLSRNIVAADPTVEGIAEGLAQARARIDDWHARLEAAQIDLPQTWDEAFADVIPRLVTRLCQLQGSPALPTHDGTEAPERVLHPAFRTWPTHEYDVYRRERLAERAAEYPPVESPGLISVLTPVWNTDPQQLEELADSVLGQDLPANFEWIVLDNGSDRGDTRAVLERLASAPGVRFYRSETNLGIIAGTRYCLERASGRYVATVDHDDLLAPDAVRVLTHSLVRHGFPPYAYTDEDKAAGRHYRDPYFKPDWDPVLFSTSCYIAHLIVFDRQRALELGAYTDARAEGSHDWDTFSRFLRAGHEPLHIPEVLYTWRMHQGSTAGNIASKSFIHDSQRHVIERLVEGLAAEPNFRVEPSPLFDGTPDWWIRRVPTGGKPLTTILIGGKGATMPRLELASQVRHEIVRFTEGDSLTALLDAAKECASENHLVHLLLEETEPEGSDWYWEALGLLELFPDTAIVGGRIHRGGRVLSAAGYFGFGRGCDSPDRGRSVRDPGYFAQMWKPHSVSAVPLHHCVVEAKFFLEFVLRYARVALPTRHLGPWLGAFARTQGRRVIYTPFFSATTAIDLEGAADVIAWATFREVHHELLPESRFLSPRLGLTPATAYRCVDERARRQELAACQAVDYATALAADRSARAMTYVEVSHSVTFSLLTSVYTRTPVELFLRLAESVLSQSLPFHQWVIVVDGPIPQDLEQEVARVAHDERVTLVRHPESVGIVGGLKRAFEHATGDFVIPMDHDDLLEPDALQVLSAAIEKTGADLIYSDEDTVSGDEFLTPFRRPDFDPVLNLESSYIWHACAFRRERALRLAVYSDPGAEFCHDWDTVIRFAEDGARIAHVPHVLYHWRTHAGSQSYSGSQNQGSVASTRHVLGRVVSRQARPDLYEVRPFPVFRGGEEWYIARREEAAPLVDFVTLSYAGSPSDDVLKRAIGHFPFCRTSAVSLAGGWSAALKRLGETITPEAKFVALLMEGYVPADDAWPWEAVRLLELHSDVAVVSGRLIDDAGVVVDAGARKGRWAVHLNDFVGRHRSDAGPFALALKPHSIDQPCDALVVVDAAFLRAAVETGCRDVPSSLRDLLASTARRLNRRIAYSPLIEVMAARGCATTERSSTQGATAPLHPVSRNVRYHLSEHVMPTTDEERAAHEAVMQRRRERLLNDFVVSGLRGVEIGPLSRPVVRRHEAEVYYVDHCSTEELREKYAGDHAHVDNIEEVDYIWGDCPLAGLLGAKTPVDFIVAAHVIEHVPDIAGWLAEMAEALKVGGRLLLIVPDKRYTFDIYRRLSSFEEIVCAKRERRRRPGLRQVLDHFANVVKADTYRLWEDYRSADNLDFHHDPEFLSLAVSEYAQGKYIDVHCWVFTPWHFMHLMGRMVEEFGLPFQLRYFLTAQPHDLEFYVQLEKTTKARTDWEAEARGALEEALWPKHMPRYPADGLLSQLQDPVHPMGSMSS